MQLDIRNKDLQTLQTLYNQESEKLNEMLLKGESWNNLKPVCRNITELAKVIQKNYGVIVTTRTGSTNPAEFPQNDQIANQPVE